MDKKNIIIYGSRILRIVIIILVVSVALNILVARATDFNYSEETGFTGSTHGQANLGGSGMVYCASDNVTINTIVKVAGDGATKCYIYTNQTAKNIEKQANFSGNNCYIDFYITNGECKIIGVDKEGSLFEQFYDSTASFPINTNKGYYSSGALYWDAHWWQFPLDTRWDINKIIVNKSVDNPSMILNGSWTNTTFNISVIYNASFSYNTIDTANCSFYQDNILRDSAEVNLSETNTFFYSWGYIDHNFIFNITCINFEANNTIGYSLNVNSYDYDQVLLNSNYENNRLLNLIYTAVGLMFYAIVWGILLFVGYKMIKDGNFVAGVPLMIASTGFGIYFALVTSGISVILQYTFILISLITGITPLFIRKIRG